MKSKDFCGLVELKLICKSCKAGLAVESLLVLRLQSSHDSMLHPFAPSPTSNLKRSIFHSEYILMVALMAALWPGPILAGLASSCLRHMPEWSAIVQTRILNDGRTGR